MNFFFIIFLGLLQGLTEFLPISSSGHLALSRYFFNLQEEGLTIDVALHFGTLLSILWYYRKILFLKETWQLALPIGVGITPAVCLGLALESHFQKLSGNPVIVGVCFLITGLVLLSTKNNHQPDVPQKIGWQTALKIGLAQMFALLPGISRSGSTIVAGLHLGLSRKQAVDFSFLMAIPLLLGATCFKSPTIFAFTREDMILVAWGVSIAFFSGLLAIHLVIAFLKDARFHYFAYYCFGMGILAIGVGLIRFL